MQPKDLLVLAVKPALTFLESRGIKQDAASTVQVLNIAGQESNWQYRVQIGGPAHSYWQFEEGGGVVGVLNHAASASHMKALCAWLDITATPDQVYAAMIYNDVLAAGMARLLLYTDPQAMPAVDDYDGSWTMYRNVWRPGAPHYDSWHARRDTARQAVGA